MEACQLLVQPITLTPFTMKKGIFLPSLIGLLALSCTVQEIETQTPPYEPAPGDDVFYASLAPESDTKVYLDENIKILWNEADQISIFNETTLNKKYEFMGETGDNAGYFKKKSDGEGTESPVDYVCAVYPYKKATTLSESGVLTLTLPEEQTYQDGSFGLEANTMVSTTDGVDNLLRFKNVGGYIVFKFFGQWSDGSTISVSSIKLEGRNGELLSGEATMTPVIDELPDIEMASTAGTSITLNCSKAVKLGKTEGKATLFWMVVPPTVFSNGILITVTDKDGKVFTKETDQVLTVERNKVLRFKAIEVIPEDPVEPEKVIYYTTSDKETVEPADGAIFGANIISNKYVDLKGILKFDGNVTQIGDHAFEGCENLTNMTLPSTVTIIGESAFKGCTNLGAPNTPSGSEITEPSKGPNRSGETTLVIPEGVTSIGAHAFEDCSSLTSIIIPEGVETIGAYAFTNCTSLTSITIPSTVTSIGDQAFAGCENLSSIDLPEGVEMGLNVFMGRTGITSVTIPEGTTSIGDYAYAWCTNLTEVIIPETVTSIGKHAFEMCSSLTEIIIPDSVTSIGENAFNDCENIVSINIPAGITKIETGTFAACSSLTSIEIPNSVKRIGSSAFESCFDLANVSLPSSIERIDSYAFAQCNSFTTFTIPSKVTQISAGLFNECIQLSSVNIHDGVESIERSAFYGCTSLTSINIPSSVTCIEDDVFHGCAGLISITIEAINPPVTEYGMEFTFVDTNDCPIYVPAESVNAYREADGWSQYASRIYAIAPQTGSINDHAYVNLGTGAKWATMNVGATSSVEPGIILPWEEGKAAAEEWGESWRLPTRDELEILTDEDKFTWTLDSENNGFTITSKIAGYVGNSIFLPIVDAYDPGNPAWNMPGTGYYWSSTPFEGGAYHYLEIEDAYVPGIGQGHHTLHYSVRPVAD